MEEHRAQGKTLPQSIRIWWNIDRLEARCSLHSRPERARPSGDGTPVVEDALKKEFGIKCPWDDRNFSSYIQLLIDEINDKTHYDLKLQPWKDYSGWKTRIRVRKKESKESKIIQQIQLYGLQMGKFLEEHRVKELLTQLLDHKST